MGIAEFADAVETLAPSRGNYPASQTERLKSRFGVDLSKSMGIFERDRAFYLDVMSTNIAAASFPFPARLKLGQQSPSAVPRFYTVSRGVMPKISPIFTSEATVIGWLRAARTALAVERFRHGHGGTWPARLEELAPSYCKSVPTDPVDGGPLRFEIHETGYVIHSSGKSFRVER